MSYQETIQHFKSMGYRIVRITTKDGLVYIMPLTEIYYLASTCYYDLTVKKDKFDGEPRVRAVLTGHRHTVNDMWDQNFVGYYIDHLRSQIAAANAKIATYDDSYNKITYTMTKYFSSMKKHIMEAFPACGDYRFSSRIDPTNMIHYEDSFYCDRLIKGDLKFEHSANIKSSPRGGNIYKIYLANEYAKNIVIYTSNIASIEGVDDSPYFVWDKEMIKAFQSANA